MKQDQDYLRDIAEIRSMMERSSKFLSLSGWAGILAGFYALSGAFIAYTIFGFNPDEIIYSPHSTGTLSDSIASVIYLANAILVLALITAIFLSYKNAHKKGEKVWNPTSKRLLIHMGVPLISGGLLIIIMIFKGMIGLIAPFSLLFYGLALYNASKFTYNEVRILGLIQISLGLVSSYFVEYGLLIWAFGFGIVHIIYGIYMHYRYER